MNAGNAKIWEQKQKERQKTLRQLQRTPKGSFRSYYLAGLIVVLLLPVIAFGVYLYRNYEGETPLELSANTIFVRAGGNFQAALNQAKPGDTILLQSGATFKGSFNLPMKAGNEFITIRSSVPETQLPPAETRIEPAKYAAVLPKLVSLTEEPVINAVNGAHHYRFIGVEFGPTKGGAGNIIQLGTTEEKNIAELPHHIEFDRVYIHGSPTEGQRRGIAANGKFIRISNSHISDIKKEGDESQAIGVWGTDGPVEIINNYLEAAAENVLFGGAGSFLKLVPTDCIVRNNHINKPIEWKGNAKRWVIKNLFEIKNGRRIKVENNLLTNNWGMGQDGTAVLFTTRADNGKESIIEDIEFSNNIVRGAAGGINIYGEEGGGGHRLTIRNNLFADITARKWDGDGFFIKSTMWDGVTIENNTVIHDGNIAISYGTPVTKLVFRNNIVSESAKYGFIGDDMAAGKDSINKYFPNADISYNAIVGGKAVNYRGRNLYPASIKDIGFVNPEANDYRLRPDSPLRGKGFSSKQIGADLDAK